MDLFYFVKSPYRKKAVWIESEKLYEVLYEMEV